MAQQPMYSAIPNSPVTDLAVAIDEAATSFDVLDGNALPAAPNLATIGSSETAETVLYTGKSGNTLSGVTRGFNGTVAKSWPAGSKVARYFTAYDHDAFRQNIADHETRLAGAESTLSAATNAATPNTVVKRDANGRFKAAAPAASDDVARKVDLDAHAAITNGAHGATSAATPNTIAQRDANGRFKAAAPSASDDVARKAEVDAVPYNVYRQAIINGNFDVWQRGTSFTNPATPTYTADRFFIAANADGGTFPTSIVHSRTQLASGELNNSYYCYSITTNGSGSGFGPIASYGVFQRIEHGVRYLCGNKKVTLSFYARSNIPGKRLAVNFKQKYGSGGTPSPDDILPGNVFTLTSAWTKYSVTVTTTNLSGKVFGSNGDDNLQIGFYYLWGGTISGELVPGGTTPETFGGSGFINIAQIQVNAGDAALPFQPRSFAEELALCQRYYEKTYNYADPPGAVTGNGMVTALSKSAYILADCGPFKVEKRIKPTMTVYSPSGVSGKVALFDNGTDVTVTGIEFHSTSHAGRVAVSSGGAIEGTYQFHWVADAEI